MTCNDISLCGQSDSEREDLDYGNVQLHSQAAQTAVKQIATYSLISGMWGLQPSRTNGKQVFLGDLCPTILVVIDFSHDPEFQ